MEKKKVINTLSAILAGVLLVLLASCNITNEDLLETGFGVSELPRSSYALPGGFKPDDYRSRYIVFKISTKLIAPGEYRIGAKLATSNTPSVYQLISSSTAITRNVSKTPINIYLPYHIEGTYFDDNSSRDYDTLKDSLLLPENTYKVYITLADGSTDVVGELLEVTMEKAPNLPGGEVYGFPPAYTYSHRKTDPLVLMASMGDTITDQITWQQNHRSLTTTNYDTIGTEPIGYTYHMVADDKLMVLITEDFQTDKSRLMIVSHDISALEATFVVPD